MFERWIGFGEEGDANGRALERLVIFDSDQNFHFELARGHGVEREGPTPAAAQGLAPPITGTQAHEHAPGTRPTGAAAGTAPSGATPPSTSAGDGFRDQF